MVKVDGHVNLQIEHVSGEECSEAWTINQCFCNVVNGR